MLYSIKDSENLEKLEELASLQNQENEARLQEKLGKQNFHQDMKSSCEPPTDTIEDTSRDTTKTITGTSIENKKTLDTSNNKIMEIMNDRSIMASYFLSPPSKITNLETTSQLKIVKDSNLNRGNDLLIKTIQY